MVRVEIYVNRVDENPARHFPVLNIHSGSVWLSVFGPRMAGRGSWWGGTLYVPGAPVDIGGQECKEIAAATLAGLTFPRLRAMEVAA